MTYSIDPESGGTPEQVLEPLEAGEKQIPVDTRVRKKSSGSYLQQVAQCYEALKPILAPTASPQVVLDEHGHTSVQTFSLIERRDIVMKVQEYREFWKPKRVNLLLVAESHLYTSPREFGVSLRRDMLQQLWGRVQAEQYPLDFVNFVYCLGYGERRLVRAPGLQTRGTRDYWKLFYACQNRFDAFNEDFFSVLEGSTKAAFEGRIRTKIHLLEWMRDVGGIWLADASIVGLYVNGTRPYDQVYGQILRCCWENYLEAVVKTEQPSRIITIGKNVHDVLGQRLQSMAPQGYTWLRQPNSARGNGENLLDHYSQLFEAAHSDTDEPGFGK